MYEIVSLIVHTLDDFGNGLFFFSDATELKEIKQAHQRCRQSHRCSNIRLEVNDLFCQGCKDIGFFAVGIVFHHLGYYVSSFVDRRHSASQNICNTEYEPQKRVMPQLEKSMIVGRESLYLDGGVPVILGIIRNLADLRVCEFLHFFFGELFVKIVPYIVCKWPTLQTLGSFGRYSNEQNIYSSTDQSGKGGYTDIKGIQAMDNIELFVELADSKFIAPQFFLCEN